MSSSVVPLNEVRAGNARGRRSRQALLDAAAECFGERGFGQTRISDITAAAGLSQGAFYRHFTDKTEILVESLRDPLDALLGAVELFYDRPPSEAELVESITSFFAVYAGNRQVLRVIREAAAMHEPVLTELWLDVRERYLDRIAEWLAALRAGGHVSVPDGDVRLTAEVLAAMLDQMAYTRMAIRPAGADAVSADEVEELGRVTGRAWYQILSGGR